MGRQSSKKLLAGRGLRRVLGLGLLAMLGGCGRPSPAPEPEPGRTLAVTFASDKEFVPPGPRQRRNAVGPLEHLTPTLQRSFSPGVAFAPVAVPEPGDWLDRFYERGQTYAEFLKHPGHIPDDQRDTIYLLPIGQFPNGLIVEEDRTVLVRSPEIEILAEHVERYFGLEVAVMKAVDMETLAPETRERDGRTQVLTRDLLTKIRPQLPANGYCLIALTNDDLYADPGQEFSFGYATLDTRVGVYSFARFDPQFSGEPRGPNFRRVILERSLKIMSHEIGHMFGLEHCTYYACVMNGSSDLIETDRHPLHMCPVCLRKLHRAVGFDPVARYLELQNFYASVELAEEARWLGDRATFITGEY